MLPICKCNEQLSSYSVRFLNSFTESINACIPNLPYHGNVAYSKPLMEPSLKGISGKLLSL